MYNRGRAQLSFEFLLYLSIAALGIVWGYGLFNVARANVAGGFTHSAAETFASQIDYNMAFQNSSFYAIIPSGICTNEGHVIKNISAGVNRTGIPLNAPLYINLHMCEGKDALQLLTMSYAYNGTYVLSGS